jgi:hypothetical protein
MNRIWTVVYIERTNGKMCMDIYDTFSSGVEVVYASYDLGLAKEEIGEKLLREDKQLVALIPGSHASLAHSNNCLGVP